MNANEVVAFLHDHPDFFDTHADLFAIMKVPHPHEGKAVSLAERQVLTLRERVRGMEMRVAELVRAAAENEHISDRLLLWCRALMKERDPAQLPDVLLAVLAEVFSVPLVALRIWGAPEHGQAGEGWRAEVSAATQAYADAQMSPYCGPNTGFEAAGWLDGEAKSLVLIPLRVGVLPQAFGLLVLASPDPDRFTPAMGTAFLARIGELASASLSRLV